MNRVFVGDAQACFSHWAEAFPASKREWTIHLMRKKKLLAEFLCVSERTLERWLAGEHPPKTTSALKLWFFFRDICGYRVVELERLEAHSPLLVKLAEVLGYSVASVDEVISFIGGYTHSCSLYELFDGTSRPSRSRGAQICTLCEVKEQEVAKRRSYWRCKFGSSSSDSTQTPVEAVLGAMERLELLAVKCGPKEREDFRRELGNERFRELAELIQMVCTESLRKKVLLRRAQRRENFDDKT